ncbi:amidohydrolase family protein [Nonomuraea basaltis]|uniref:amidohydrolase family protein n=1 Tax=Nonomuraea basaltis TaxID=2495887 RepID=UPI0019806FEB
MREGRSGTVSGPDERIGLHKALRTYTTTAAWQDHADRWKGSLRRGMAGDLCVLDGRLVDEHGRPAGDAHEISSVPVKLTIVNGTIAYDASDPSTRAVAAETHGTGWAGQANPVADLLPASDSPKGDGHAQPIRPPAILARRSRPRRCGAAARPGGACGCRPRGR